MSTDEQQTINRLHKALAEGNGVEDGGIWEDRALSAETTLTQAADEFDRRADAIAAAPRFDDTGGEEIAYRAAAIYLRERA
jgi:hypothetical protein